MPDWITVKLVLELVLTIAQAFDILRAIFS